MKISCCCVHNAPPNAHGLMRDFRALWLLEELGLDYDIEWFDLAAGDLAGGRFLELNPLGQIPAITVDGVPLFESGAIGLLLAERTGQLIAPGGSAERAEQVKWAFAATSTFDPHLFNLFFTRFFVADEAGSELRADRYRDKCVRLLKGLEGELADRDTLAGGAFSFADLLMSAVLCLAEATDLLGDFPNVAAFADRHRARAAHARALAVHNSGPERMTA